MSSIKNKNNSINLINDRIKYGTDGGINVNKYSLFVNPITNNIGIGNSSPSVNLDVSGDVNISNRLLTNNISGTSGQILSSLNNGKIIWKNESDISSGSSTNSLNIDISSTDSAYNNYITFVRDVSGYQKLLVNNNFVYNPNNNYLGIGTSNPTANLDISGDILVKGNLNVLGSYTTICSSIVQVTDPMIMLGLNNNNNTKAIGFYSQYNDGTNKYTGFIKKPLENSYYLFSDISNPPSDDGSNIVLPSSGINTKFIGVNKSSTGTYDLDVSGVIKTSSINDINSSNGNNGEFLSATSTGKILWKTVPMPWIDTSGGIYYNTLNDISNVGIGIQTPSFTLDISSSKINGVRVSGKNASSIFNIDCSNNRIGIGQNFSNMQYTFDVSGTTRITTPTVRIGVLAGDSSQNINAISIGNSAGQTRQGTLSIAIGFQAGVFDQSSNSIAIGSNAGSTRQGALSIAIGSEAGRCNQQDTSIAIGNKAGISTQFSGAIAIGNNAGFTSQGTSAIAFGVSAGVQNQGSDAIAIGSTAGNLSQSSQAIAIGSQAGNLNQLANSIAIGSQAGQSSQRGFSVAIGSQAGQYSQSGTSIAIGFFTGNCNQYSNTIAIGREAASYTQFSGGIAIGFRAGQTSQGTNSISLGNFAGITNQHSGTTIINSSGLNLNSVDISSLYISPLRSAVNTTSRLMMYNPTTSEVWYSGADAGNASKTFIIQHPIEDDKYLVHACLEGPEAGVYYRGKGEITNDESVEIYLPEYTKKFTDFSIDITPIGKNNKNIYSVSEVDNGMFYVYGNNGKFFWKVFAKRNDIVVEPNKLDVVVKGEGPYTYISN